MPSWEISVNKNAAAIALLSLFLLSGATVVVGVVTRLLSGLLVGLYVWLPPSWSISIFDGLRFLIAPLHVNINMRSMSSKKRLKDKENLIDNDVIGYRLRNLTTPFT
uniref:Uncharacterized protein n=1 Tax=Parascaris equorum TaxID=6256 RepID=A0A914RLX8_PAREQ